MTDINKLIDALMLYSKLRQEKYEGWKKLFSNDNHEGKIERQIYQAKIDELSELYFGLSEFKTKGVFYITKDYTLNRKGEKE